MDFGSQPPAICALKNWYSLSAASALSGHSGLYGSCSSALHSPIRARCGDTATDLP